MGALAFLLIGFILCVGGVYIFMKSDDSAYNRTKKDVQEFRGEIKADITKLGSSIEALVDLSKSFKISCAKSFEELKDADNKMNNTIGALELELQRIKEKQNRIEVRAIPTTHTMKLEMSEPIPVEVYRKIQPKKKLSDDKTRHEVIKNVKKRMKQLSQ